MEKWIPYQLYRCPLSGVMNPFTPEQFRQAWLFNNFMSYNQVAHTAAASFDEVIDLLCKQTITPLPITGDVLLSPEHAWLFFEDEWHPLVYPLDAPVLSLTCQEKVTSLSIQAHSYLTVKGNEDTVALTLHEMDYPELSFQTIWIGQEAVWSPDNRWVASFPPERSQIRVHAAQNQVHERSCYQGHQAPIQTVAWSPDGQMIVSTQRENHWMHLWKASNGESVERFALSRSYARPVHIHTLAWSSQDILAVGANDGTIQLFEMVQRRHIQTFRSLPSRTIHLLAWSPDGRHLIALDNQNTIAVWHVSAMGVPHEQ